MNKLSRAALVRKSASYRRSSVTSMTVSMTPTMLPSSFCSKNLWTRMVTHAPSRVRQRNSPLHLRSRNRSASISSCDTGKTVCSISCADCPIACPAVHPNKRWQPADQNRMVPSRSRTMMGARSSRFSRRRRSAAAAADRFLALAAETAHRAAPPLVRMPRIPKIASTRNMTVDACWVVACSDRRPTSRRSSSATMSAAVARTASMRAWPRPERTPSIAAWASPLRARSIVRASSASLAASCPCKTVNRRCWFTLSAMRS